MLLGIVGLNGSGKDSLALILKEDFGFEHFDLGQLIRDELKSVRKDYLDRKEMVFLANDYRTKHGNDFWIKKALENSSSENIVITSIRNPSEVVYLKNNNGKLIEVFCDINLRFERTLFRVKNNPKLHGEISFEEFKKNEEKELSNKDPSKQQVLVCIKLADFRVDNNNSKTFLKKQLHNLLNNL
jgi:dephospho-CoA kinase